MKELVTNGSLKSLDTIIGSKRGLKSVSTEGTEGDGKKPENSARQQ